MLEFLTESDVPDSVKDVVDVIGIDAFKGLVKLAGGSLLYIPNESNLVKPIRNRKIRDEFKGSYRDISMKYAISEVQVRNIINKEWVDLIIDLFLKLYNKNKHYKVRLYAKNDEKSLYDEYEVKDWFLSEKGLELDLA